MAKSGRFINPLCPNGSLNLAAGDEEWKDTHGGLTFMSCVTGLNTDHLMQEHKHIQIVPLFLCYAGGTHTVGNYIRYEYTIITITHKYEIQFKTNPMREAMHLYLSFRFAKKVHLELIWNQNSSLHKLENVQ